MLFTSSQAEFLLLSQHTYHSKCIILYFVLFEPNQNWTTEKCHTDPCKESWGEGREGAEGKKKRKHNQKPIKTLIMSLKAARQLENSDPHTSNIPVQ